MITTGAVWPTHLPRMVAVLGDEQLSTRFAEQGEELIVEQPALVNAAIASWAGSRGARVAMREAQSAGWPVVVVNDPKSLLTDEHLVARGFWVEGDSPMGPVPHTGAPWKIDGGGWELRLPAPRLGEHTDAILRESGSVDAEIAGLRAAGVIR
jgi:crotonobetainyl-CoA:carnitine CoA-transferase CaiB-like acyl-CoA transferase